VNEWENDRDILLILATLEGLDQLLGIFFSNNQNKDGRSRLFGMIR
jgi:hypothetical protein